MVNRSNYLEIKEHLLYLSEVMQLSPASLGRYWFHLRHLLLWASDTPLSRSHTIRPAFPAYVASLPGKDGRPNLASSSQKKIIESARRFYQWARSNYPREYSALPVAWVDAIRPPRAVQSTKEHTFVTLDEVVQLISLPVDERGLATLRDHAAAAMLCTLTNK